MNRGVELLTLAVLLGLCGARTRAADAPLTNSVTVTNGWRIEELGLAPRIAEPAKSETTDGCRFVTVSVTVDDERQVFVDGKPGPKYPMVKEDSLRLSANGKRVGYVAGQGDHQFAVIDGKPGPLYGAVANITFSRDGGKLAYAALKTNKECVVVVDGVEGPAYQAIIAESPIVSQDGSRVAYGAKKGAKWLVNLDGKESPLYDRIGHLVISSNGAVCAFQARTSRTWVTVVNGSPSLPYDGTGPMAVSVDGRHIAYAVWRGKQCFVSLDGKLGPSTDGLVEGSLSFSPDGKRLAYKAAMGSRRVVFLDGKPGEEYDGMAKGPVTWSADGKRVGYQARKGDKWLVVIDGKESPLHEGLSLNSPVFSPDGSLVAYGAVKADRWNYSINGTNTPLYDALGTIAFSADNKHTAYSAKSGRAFVALNGQNSPPFKNVASGPVFRRDGTMEFLAVDEQDRLLRVTRKP